MSSSLVRKLLLASANLFGTILVSIAIQKWGAEMSLPVFAGLWLIPVLGWGLWLWTLPSIRKRWYLLYTYPGMSMFVFIIGGAVLGLAAWAVAQRVALTTQGSEQLTFNVHVLKDPHPNGLSFGGISWREHYVDIRLDILNGPVQIQNLELLIMVDRLDETQRAAIQSGADPRSIQHVTIRQVSQLSQIPNLAIIPAIGVTSFDLIPLDEKGLSKGVSIPTAPIEGGFNGFRLHCPVLYSGSPLNLVMAGTTLDAPPDEPLAPGKALAYTPGPRRFPRKIEITGSYETKDGGAIQQHSVSFTQEITKQH